VREMKLLFSLLGIWVSVALLAIVVAILAPENLAWAKTILCPGIAGCFGTDEGDTMVGDDGINEIFASGGDDNISGKGGGDFAGGFEGDDLVSGGKRE
jgi:Ca2+-binding RTX toxin-like protein